MVNFTKLTAIKFLELILVAVLLVLHYNSTTGFTQEEFLSSVAFGGYLIILIGIFAGIATGTPVNRRIDLFFTLVGLVLFLVTGILIFNNHRHNDVVRGVICIVEAVIFLIDAFFTFRGEA